MSKIVNTNDEQVTEAQFNEVYDDLSKDAAKVLKDIDCEDDVDKQTQCIATREDSYTNLIEYFTDNYTKTHRVKRILKVIFFIIVMLINVAVVSGAIAALIIVAKSEVLRIEVIIGAIASIITSIIALPTVIAKYLFPIGEDKDMADMVKNMQSYDLGLKQYISEKEGKSSKLKK